MAVNIRMRLDAFLVARGFAVSLAQAQALILAGQVIVDDQKVQKASTLVAPDAQVRMRQQPRYVSRGGEKLAAAINALHIAPICQGAVVLDVGASTGGFTDCCLQHGARTVYALDIGTNQLAWKMRSDPRVVVMEQTDIRQLAEGYFQDVSLVVADISFNSVATLLPAVVRVVPPTAVHYLVLVKPQFELPRGKVPAGGVVTDDASRHEALAMVESAFARLGLPGGRSVASALPGRRGNQEIFYYVPALGS